MGPEHPNTLATRSHLAFWTGVAGDAAGVNLKTSPQPNDLYMALRLAAFRLAAS